MLRFLAICLSCVPLLGAINAQVSQTWSNIAGQPGTFGAANGTGAAAQFHTPKGIVLDAGGNITVADSENHQIRKISPAGVVTTLAGNGTAGSLDGTGSGAQFNSPGGVAVDISGNVYVADTNNHAIRKVTPAGVVTTLAGDPSNFALADGTGAAAQFHFPWKRGRFLLFDMERGLTPPLSRNILSFSDI